MEELTRQQSETEKFKNYFSYIKRPGADKLLEWLEEKDNQLREPYSKMLDDGIFEIRCTVGNNITRVVYIFYYEGKIILTNGFIKKTQKIPSGQIKLAKRRRADFQERMGRS